MDRKPQLSKLQRWYLQEMSELDFRIIDDPELGLRLSKAPTRPRHTDKKANPQAFGSLLRRGFVADVGYLEKSKIYQITNAGREVLDGE